MMDREPFATYRPYANGLMADGFVDGKQYAYLSVAEAKHQIQTINAAFNARVDAEARKSVEAFREKAKKALVDYYGIEKYGPIDIISNLPTEPEEK